MQLIRNDNLNPLKFQLLKKPEIRLNTPKSQLSHLSSNELLPKTKVVEFYKTNNFRIQSFSSYNMKFGENPKKQWVYGVFI